MEHFPTFSEEAFLTQAERDGITHISTGVAVVRDGKVLMARRAAGDYLGGVYELPGGGVDAGETIVDGAIREVKEETGLTVVRVLAVFDGFDYSTDRKPHVRQVNFLVEAEPGDVVLDPAEHDACMWVGADNVTSVHMSENMRTCVANALELISEQALRR